MNKFMKAIDFVIDFVIGDFSINILDDKRSGDDRRVKKPRKRKNEKRKTQRRKSWRRFITLSHIFFVVIIQK